MKFAQNVVSKCLEIYSNIYYIKCISDGNIHKINLGSAPENCKIYINNLRRSDDDIKLFWYLNLYYYIV